MRTTGCREVMEGGSGWFAACAKVLRSTSRSKSIDRRTWRPGGVDLLACMLSAINRLPDSFPRERGKERLTLNTDAADKTAQAGGTPSADADAVLRAFRRTARWPPRRIRPGFPGRKGRSASRRRCGV